MQINIKNSNKINQKKKKSKIIIAHHQNNQITLLWKISEQWTWN